MKRKMRDEGELVAVKEEFEDWDEDASICGAGGQSGGGLPISRCSLSADYSSPASGATYARG